MIFSFRLVLDGSPVRLPNIKPLFNEVEFSTPSTNSGSVYFSDTPVNAEATSHRFALASNKSLPFRIANLDELYVDGAAADCLDMMCAVKNIPKEVKDAVIKPRQVG